MSAAANDPIAAQIEAEVAELVAQRQQHEVLFYGWREPYKSLVAAKQAEVRASARPHPARRARSGSPRPPPPAPRPSAQIDARMPELTEVNAERERLRLKARQAVGLWSAVGVADVRRLFWQSWEEGKAFAKRMTFWDIMLAGTSRREETLVAVLLRWLSQFLMNLSLGLISAVRAPPARPRGSAIARPPIPFTLLPRPPPYPPQVLWFSARAVSLVFSYQPGIVSGGAFVAISVFGAAGSVLLFLALCYTAAIGGVYLVAKQAATARIEAQQRARQQHLRGGPQQGGGGYDGSARGGRAHYE